MAVTIRRLRLAFLLKRLFFGAVPEASIGGRPELPLLCGCCGLEPLLFR